MITFWERDDPFALFCVVFSVVYFTFHFGVPGQVWYLASKHRTYINRRAGKAQNGNLILDMFAKFTMR